MMNGQATIGQTAKITIGAESHWQTSDLWLGAYLRSQKYRIADAKKVAGRVVMFFSTDDGLQEVLRTYHNREAQIEPLNFKALLNEVRDLIGEIERGGTMGGKKS